MQKFRHLTDEEVDDFQHLINRRYHHILALTEMNPEKAGEALHR
jgi:hypothetical protein